MTTPAQTGTDPVPYAKPLPRIDADSAPFWAGCQAGELRIPRCTACGHWFFPPRPLCPRCHQPGPEFVAVPPQGTVYTAITFEHAFHPAFKDEVPYNVSLIELACGVRLWANVLGCPPAEVAIGARVEAEFLPVTAAVTLPRFRLAAQA